MRADRGDLYARSALAEILADRGELDELRDRANVRPDDHEAARSLVDLLVQRGNLDEAQRVLLAQVMTGDRRATQRLPELLFQRGRHDEAWQLARYGLNPDGSHGEPAQHRLHGKFLTS